MIKLIVLVAIIAGLFVFLSPMPAAFWSILPLILIASVFFDAMKRGRYVIAARADKTDAIDEASRVIAGVTIFHAVWMGLQAPGSAAPPSGVGHYGGETGAELGGFDGGFDGGGGDGGGGGGF